MAQIPIAGWRRWSPALLLTFTAIAIAGIWVATTAQWNGANAFLPHSFCYTGNPSLIRLHLVSDVLIGIAYFSIPLALIYFIRKRRDMPFSWIFVLFGVFIVACGATHWMEVWTLWNPDYWLAGGIKAITAAASVPTAVALVLLIPQALTIPSVGQLREANAALSAENARRRDAERELLEARERLEERVQQRTLELAEANEALHKEREWLRVTLASIGDAVIATDMASRVQFINGVASTLTGWTREEALTRPVSEVFEIVTEAGQEGESPTLLALREQRVVGMSSNTVLLARDGRRIPIDDSAAPIRNAEGRAVGAVLVFRDITRQRHEESERQSLLTELRAANDLLDTVFNQAPVGLGLWDEQLRFVRLNDALAEMNGLPREAHLGKTVRELLPKLDSSVMESFQQVLRTGEPILNREVSGSTPAQADRVRHWRVSYYPVRVADRIVGVGAVCDEITDELAARQERIELLDAEKAARAAAEEANRLKDDFLANVSHELRNPLNAILGWVHVLQAKDVSAEQAAKAIDRIGRSARAQARLIEDLLDVSRIISGKLRLDMRRVDVLPTVSGAIEALSPAAEAKGIELRLDPAAASAAVLGDSERLSQVFWNLISNAIKFTPIGGHVNVGVRRDGEWIEVAVQDDGQGIAGELLPSIFDRFSQGLNTRRHGGLGLGLSIVKTIVELHGGTAKAMSDGDGRGARFSVRLPSAQPAAKERHAALGALMLPPSRLEGVRAVIVDDEEDARETLSFALTRQGANVVVCASIDEVKTALSATVPDLLIADIALAGASGLDLARWLRGHAYEPLRDLPAIALTAYAHPEDRLRALAAGFTMHVPKPVEPDELAVVVASVVGRFKVG